MPRNSQNNMNPACCCICGHIGMSIQTIDHTCMNHKELKQFLQAQRLENKEIQILLDSVRQFYIDLQKKIYKILKQDQSKVEQNLLSHYYGHLDMEKNNVKLIAQILNNDHSKLPNRKFIKLIRKIKSNPSSEVLQNEIPQFEQLKYEINKYIENYKKGKTINLQDFKIHLMYPTAIDKVFPELKPRKSLSDVSNPEQANQPQLTTHSWKNLTVTLKSKTINLSNKSINDQQLLKQIPILSSFKNVKQFQIRHNKLTALSCRIIASSMKHISVLDVRGNKIGDEGIIKLVEGIPTLKNFMMSETECGNQGAQAIINGVSDLQMLWCQNNRIDGTHGIRISEKPKLKLLSLKGNKIQGEQMVKIKKIFNPKGYINI